MSSSDLSFGPGTNSKGSDQLPAAAPVTQFPGLDMQEIQAAADLLDGNDVLKRAFNTLTAALSAEKEKFNNLSRDCLIMERALGEIKKLIPDPISAEMTVENSCCRWVDVKEIISSLEAGTYVHPSDAETKANFEAAPNDSQLSLYDRAIQVCSGAASFDSSEYQGNLFPNS